MGTSKIKTMPTDVFTELVKSSISVEEILTKAGYKVQQQHTIQDVILRCEKEHIDYSHLLFPKEGEQRCSQCGMIKKYTEFYSKRKICKDCTKQNEREKYLYYRKQLNDYKQECACQKCGCNKFYMLDFHHVNPEEKEAKISDLSRVKIENITKELNKCIVLCANCHREFHWLNSHYGMTLEEYLSAE